MSDLSINLKVIMISHIKKFANILKIFSLQK